MWIICYDKLYKCICYVLHEFSCWASAHGCCMWQVEARSQSTDHEYGERGGGAYMFGLSDCFGWEFFCKWLYYLILLIVKLL